MQQSPCSQSTTAAVILQAMLVQKSSSTALLICLQCCQKMMLWCMEVRCMLLLLFIGQAWQLLLVCQCSIALNVSSSRLLQQRQQKPVVLSLPLGVLWCKPTHHVGLLPAFPVATCQPLCHPFAPWMRKVTH
jgi:hypothetical protein